MTPRVLVVDDDAGVRYTLRGVLEDEGYEVEDAADGAEALARVDDDTFHLVLTDLRMPKVDGLSLLRRLRDRPQPPRVILITAHGSERTAVEAMKHGAYDYFRKPFEPDELLAVVARAVESVRLAQDNERLEAELNLARSMAFASEPMGRLALLVARVAPRDVTVLVTGESGTGKERLAEAIVRASGRAEAPFVRFNCAAITPELAEAELFGHAKGAFTGAVRSRAGLFREADGGTLFLDEVAELDPRTQAKLLRVLQEGEVRPVGEDRPVPVDVRILAATHRDLATQVREGTFREDLMYRLKVVNLHVPPLRERPADVPVLAQLFLDEFAERYGAGPFVVTDALRARLLAYRWPGNVRELRNAIESVVALSPPDALDPSLLPGDAPGTEPNKQATLAERLAAYERGLLVAALEAADGNRTEAAKALGIGRATLYEKLDRHRIGRDGA
ncbi:MAG TPA: sigma-54 dependent transcriptional regulator [Sandaracinaceae bacterium LLY-WYZ-13_1]|nr:sigma-54 dependent transcriptional regulator [Sandaracinaceae bacterium LLY-WYZ-13_1]